MPRAARFWRWWRVLLLLAMALTCIVCALSDADPTLLRSWLLPVHHEAKIEEASTNYGVDPYLVCAVIKCESNWDEDARSDAGAVGLMQMMPSTAEEVARLGLVDASAYDPDNLTDPDTSIIYGVAYLAYLQRNLSDRDEVIAAYNAGLGAVSQWIADGSDVSDAVEYPETAAYLARVNSAYERYAAAYADGLVESS